MIQQKIKKEIKSQQFQHEQLSDDYRKQCSKTQHLTSSVQSTEDDDEIKKIILKTHCDQFNNRKNSLSSSSTTSTTSTSSSIANAYMSKNKYYHCKKNFVPTNSRRVQHNKNQSPSSNSSFTSSTATPESSSSEYENCTYIAKPKNPTFIRINDSANESISSIDGTNGCEKGKITSNL